MKITKRQIAEMCAESYMRGYQEAIDTLKDTKNAIPQDQMVEMMMKQFNTPASEK